MNDALNEIFIDDELLEEINKHRGIGMIFAFPVVLVGKSTVYFNVAAAQSGLIKEAINWFVTKDYVIGLPAKRNDNNAFSVRGEAGCLVSAFPIQLRKDKNLQYGHYRLYKYKDGFAFKRNEPMKEDTNGKDIS